jgi:hypothetical protein
MSTPDYVIRIDPTRMEIELYGVRYALECFEHLGLGKPGDALEIIKREDGVLTLQKLHLRQESPVSEEAK